MKVTCDGDFDDLKETCDEVELQTVLRTQIRR
jgi:hypothetical protein